MSESTGSDSSSENLTTSRAPADRADANRALVNGLNGRNEAEAAETRAENEAELARTIEGEIIPRLLLSVESRHLAEADDATGGEAGASAIVPTQDDVFELARLAADAEVDDAWAFAEAVRARGVSTDDVLLELLGPAARHLGDLWRSDERDFTHVTVGLSRLQQMLRMYGSVLANEYGVPSIGARCLLFPTPGETHSFGLFMVEEFMRRAGWDVDGGYAMAEAEVVDAVRQNHYTLVGASLSCDIMSESLTSMLAAVRQNSCNTSVALVVGGRVFLEQPELAEQVGADVAARDARDAVAIGQKFIDAATSGR